MLGKVTWTCTSGRRLNLFKRMIASFNECCEDKKMISDYICVDDRSSDYDFASMQKRYQYIKFYKNEKHGQLASLRMILDLVKTEWIFHSEDDWLYLNKDNFIKKMFDVANDDDRIRNVTLRYWQGPVVVHNDLKYYIHHYRKEVGDFSHSLRSDCDWFGLSFNPGIMHIPTLQECFKDIEKQDNFESRVWDKAIAKKYLDLGYKRANLTEQYIKHIGGGKSFYTSNL